MATSTQSSTSRYSLFGFSTVYPAPVTAPVTLRAIVADTLNWVGLGVLTPGLPIPATPVPDLLASLWVNVRRLHYSFHNSYPTLTQITPVQDSATGVLTGRVVGSDADGDVLTYHVGNGSHGTVVIGPDGSYTYTPDETFTGTDSFTISVEDVTDNPFHLYGGARIVHSFLDHYAPKALNNADTTTIMVNAPIGTAGTPTNIGNGAATNFLAHYAPAYPAPVTAPVTLRSFASDKLNWFGLGAATAGLPLPAAPVGPLLTTAWNAARQLHHTFLNSYPTLGLGAQTQDPATGVVTGSLVGSDVDQNTLTYHVGSAAHGTVALAPDGTYTYTPDETLAHLGGIDTFIASVEDVSANPFHYFGGWDIIHAILEHFTPRGLANPDTKIVTINVAPGTVNTAPVVSVPTLTAPSTTTGAVGGSISFSDAEDDTTSVAIHANPSRGRVTVDANTGQFVYTPTEEARHSAAADSATAADLTDTFTIAVTDSYGGTTLQTVTVTITPANATPVIGATSFATANPTNGVVSGTLTATDADSDPVSFSAISGPAKGTVVVESGGDLVYTPTAVARHNAAADTATPADLVDTFTVVADDGHGGTVTTTVTVAVIGANVAPTFANATLGSANPSTGSVVGTLSATDPDTDPLSFTTLTGPTKGTVSLSANGTFTYTPSAIARQNARINPGNPAYQTDAFTVMVNDGHGGTALQTVTVTVTPDNSAPVFGATTLGAANQGTGAIAGNVTASDAEGDPVSFSTQSAPTKGNLSLNANGTFTYTPTLLARHNAGANNATPADQIDSFTVLASDGRGGTTLQTVTVAVDPVVNAAPTATVVVNTNNFVNGDFSNGLTGWTATNTRVLLGGGSTVAGFATPTDPTTAPDGGTEATTVGSGTYQTTVTNGRAVMTSNLGGVVNTPAGSGGVVHGPVVVSNDPAYIVAGATVSFDWDASGGADAFDVLGYIVNVDNGTTDIMLNATGANAAATQPTTTVTYVVPTTGNYKFVFVSGSWDATRGTAAGARLTIDNVQILNNVSPSGTVTGRVAGADTNGDPLTYSAPQATPKGSVTLNQSTGAFSFTPTAGARAAAQVQGAPASDLTDTFNVTVDDGFGGTVVVPVTVPII